MDDQEKYNIARAKRANASYELAVASSEYDSAIRALAEARQKYLDASASFGRADDGWRAAPQ